MRTLSLVPTFSSRAKKGQDEPKVLAFFACSILRPSCRARNFERTERESERDRPMVGGRGKEARNRKREETFFASRNPVTPDSRQLNLAFSFFSWFCLFLRFLRSNQYLFGSVDDIRLPQVIIGRSRSIFSKARLDHRLSQRNAHP